MRKKSQVFERLTAMLLAVAMLFTVLCPRVPLSVLAEDRATVSVTEGELVANNYEQLTDAEKQLLSAGYLVGKTHTYSVPNEDDGLISVDTDSKKITAATFEKESGYQWKPVSAAVVVGSETKEDVTLENGVGTYKYDGDAFSIEVEYEIWLTVDAATQQKLLGAPAALKQGVADMDAIADADTHMGSLLLAMDILKELADGKRYTLGNLVGTFKLREEAAAAVYALKAQRDKNGEAGFDVSLSVMDYANAVSKVVYAAAEGGKVAAQVKSTYEYVKAIRDDVWADDNVVLLAYLQIEEPENYKLLQVLKNDINAWLTAVEEIAAEDWTLDADLVKDGLTGVQYSGLDLLVLALGETAGDTVTEIKNPLLASTATVKYNMSMSDINVKVVLKVVDAVTGSDTLIEAGSKSTVITMIDGATKEEIEAAIEESGIVEKALAEWEGTYVEDKFVATATELPEILSDDVDYVITYSPKIFNVTFAYENNTTGYPYGYRLLLPVNPMEGKVYDYTVNGVYYAEGSVYVVTEDATIERKEGKPYVGTNLKQLVTDRYFAAGSKADSVLTSGALLVGNEEIHVRYPDNEDGTLVKLTGNTLTAANYPSSYNNLEWIPYSYTVVSGAEETEHLFGRASEATIEETGYDRIDVVYRLALTNIDESEILELLNLPDVLTKEAEVQKSVLDRLSADRYLSNLGQLDKTKLGALNGVIDVTDFYPDDEAKTLEMQQYFKAVVSDIIAKCLDRDNHLKLYNLLTAYRNTNTGGLAYYYRNSDAIIGEIDILSSYLTAMAGDDDKMEALTILVEAAGYPEYAEKFVDLEAVLEEIKADLIAPNEAIDVNSEMLDKLVDALMMAGETASYTALPGDFYLESEAIIVNADNKVTLNVTVQIAGGRPVQITKSFTKDHVLTQDDIDDILKAIESAAAQLGVKDSLYTNDYAPDSFRALVGQTADNFDASYTFTWTPKNFTVHIEGANDQTVNVNDLLIELPASPDAAYRYEYVIDGKTYTGSYKFTVAQLETLFVNGEYTVTRNVVNVAREQMLAMVNSLNTSIKGDVFEFALVENDGTFSIVMKVNSLNPTRIMEEGLSGVARALVNSGYTYIGVDNNGALYLDESDALKISLQAVVDAVMDSGFSSDTLLEVVNADGTVNHMTLEGNVISNLPLAPLGGKMIETTMQLGNTKADASEVAFYITLGRAQSGLVRARNLYADQLAKYVTVVLEDGKANVKMNMPQKAYEAYLAVLIATGNVDITDISAVNGEIAIGFVKDLVDPIFTNSDITAQTLTNTLAKFGYNINLTRFEDLYEMFCDYYSTCEFTYDQNTGSVSGSLDVSSWIDRMDMGDIGRMIIEYDSGLEIAAEITIDNLGESYEAFYLDINAAGVANKFGLTKDLAGKLDDIAGTAVVVLLSDVEGDLTFNKTTLLNLNGFTVNGNITGNGSVTIVDVTGSEDVHGEVTGTVSGNVRIAAGKYASDVSAFVRAGYEQDADGVVGNKFYTITKDAAGNITVALNAGILATDEMPDVKTLVIDLAADLLFNGYTMNTLSIEGNQVYDITIEDLIGIYAGGNRMDTVVKKAVEMIDSAQLANIVNMVLADITDFAALQSAIENDEPILSYTMTGGAWVVSVEHVTDGDYLTVNITTGEAEDRTLNVIITGEDADKELLADLLGELAETTDADITVDMEHGLNPSNDKNVVFDWKVSGSFDIDLTAKPEYAIMITILLADGLGAPANADLIAGIKAYYEDGTMADLEAAFNALTASQILTAVKELKKDDSFADMITALGLDGVVTTEVSELEALYDAVGKIVAAALRRIGANGGSRTMESFLEGDAYVAERSNITRSYTRNVFRGYSVTVNLELTDLLISVKLFPEVLPPEFVDGTGTPEVGTHEKIAGASVDTDNGYIFIDARADGITAAELISVLTLYANNADTIDIVIGDGDLNALVCNGTKLVATASNALSPVVDVVEYTIIIMGDVNCNGRVDAGDASMLSQYLVGTMTLNTIQLLAAEMNGNDRIDVGDASRIASKIVDWDNYISVLA